MILTKEVEIRIVSTNLNHFRNLGYTVNIKDIIRVPVNYLMGGSNVKVKVKCDVCKNEKEMRYCMYLQSFKRYNFYACSSKCSSFKCKSTKKERYDDETFNNREQFLKTMDGRWDKVMETLRNTNLKKYGNENYNNMDKSKQTKLKNHGNENFVNPDKRKQTLLDRYGDENYNNREKMIETITGLSYNDYIKQLPEFELYRKRIDSYSRKQPIYLLENFEKRGNKGYWLEHMFSRDIGFKEYIPIYIIGDIVNLEMLPYRDNISKHNKCSITKERLFERYENRDKILKQLKENYDKKNNL